jgi:hypothetical protein
MKAIIKKFIPFILLIPIILIPLLGTQLTKASGSQISTVFVIVMENENWSQIKGNSNAPYINNTLLPQGAHAEQYYNPPGVHPSLPNYLWLEAGTNFGIHDDNAPTANHQSTTLHLTSLLNQANISWKAYEEGIDGSTCPLQDGGATGRYVTKHDPFVYFDDITANQDLHSSTCLSHIRPYTELASDLTNNHVARYNFITPDVCDDMHDTCGSDPIATGDHWLSQNVPLILQSSAYKNNGTLFITWDEAASGDGPIGLIALSPLAKPGYQNSIHYTHGSTLRTIEEIFGLTSLLGDAAQQTDLSDLFLPSALSTGATTPVTGTPSLCASPTVPSSPAALSPTPATSPETSATSTPATPGSDNDEDNDSGFTPETSTPPSVTTLTPLASSPTAGTAPSPCCPLTPPPTFPSSASATATPTAASSSPSTILPDGTVSSLLTAYWGDDAQKWQDLENRHIPNTIAIASFTGSNDSVFATTLTAAHASGLKVIGYVGTASHNVAEVESAIDGWYHYQMDGIFLDEATSLIHSDSDIPYYQSLHDYIKTKTGPDIVAINIGWMPHSAQALNVADILNVDENGVDTFPQFQPTSWMLAQPASRFSEIIENVTADQIASLVQMSIQHDHIGYIFLQDIAQKYDHIPPYWDQELKALSNPAGNLSPSSSPVVATPDTITPTDTTSRAGTPIPTSTPLPVTTSTPAAACLSPMSSSFPGPSATMVPDITSTPVMPAATPTSISGGKNYYVSPSGNDTNDGSPTHPFATIQQAAKVVTPGATVHVLPGTYTQPVTVTTSGSADAPITFLSDTQWGAKIETTGSSDPWTTRANYINIMGFDITSRGSRDGINNLGSFIRTVGNHVHDIPSICDNIGGAGISDGNYLAHDDDVIGNKVNNIGDTYPRLCQYVHGIYHSTNGGHIMNNISFDNAGCGINLWHAANAAIVTNNLSFGNQEHGISVGTNTSNTNGVLGDHFLVANNISIDNALLGIRERKGVGSHNRYLNNIVYGNGDAPFGDENYDWPSAVGSRDSNTITQNAQFVNYQRNGSGDYHVQPSSPAIDAGISEGAPGTDFDGNPRPQGKGVDIGPFEYRNSNSPLS